MLFFYRLTFFSVRLCLPFLSLRVPDLLCPTKLGESLPPNCNLRNYGETSVREGHLRPFSRFFFRSRSFPLLRPPPALPSLFPLLSCLGRTAAGDVDWICHELFSLPCFRSRSLARSCIRVPLETFFLLLEKSFICFFGLPSFPFFPPWNVFGF